MKIEQNNYELAKQDRNVEDQNLMVGQSDLAKYLNKTGRASQLGGDGLAAEGEGSFDALID